MKSTLGRVMAWFGVVIVAGALTACGGGGGGGPTADVRGRILLVTTNLPPNPPATVSIAGASPVQTLVDGTFIVRNASANATEIIVTASGMTRLQQKLPRLTANTVNDLGDIFLTDSTYDAEVRAVVVRADTLDPVAGATVRMSGLTTTSGADGSFVLKNLPVGLGGSSNPVGLIRATGFEDKPIVLDFPLGAGVNDLGEIQISPPVGGLPGGPTTIQGKVTLQGQTVHTGTTVTLIRDADGVELGSVLTLADGSYGFWVPVGDYQLRAERSGYQTQTVPVSVLRLDQPVTVNILLVP